MKCPQCKSNVTQPKESRQQYDNTKRLRKYKCTKCDHEFFTLEEYELETRDNLLVDMKTELDDYRELFLWLWRNIYSVSVNNSNVKDLRWNLENYTSQEIQSKLKKYLLHIAIY